MWVGLSAFVLFLLIAPYFPTGRVGPCGAPTVRSEVRSLSAALAQYRSDYDRFPPLNEDDIRSANRNIMSALMCSGPDATMALWNPRKIQFFHVAQARLRNGVFCDPWMRPYRFAYATNLLHPGPACSSGIVIWSAGRNGKDELGAGDDVVECVSDR